MTQFSPKLYPIILFVLGLLFFIPFLGYSPLFDGSELRFAEAAREMRVTNTFSYAQLNFLPDPATPPLFAWLQALSMHIFGVADNAELAARFPSAVMGIVSLLSLFFIGRKRHDARFGFLWALCYLGSVAPLVLAKSALPATTGYFFTFLGTLYLFDVLSKKNDSLPIRSLVGTGSFFGLGLLTTEGILFSLLLVLLILMAYWRVERRPLAIKSKNSLFIILLPIVCIVSRFATSPPGTDWNRALVPTDRGGFTVLYLLAFGLIGLLIVITLSSRYWSVDKQTEHSSSPLLFQDWMAAMARTYLIVFLGSPSGVLLIWFPLSYLATYHIYQVLQKERDWDTLNTYLLILGGGLVSVLMMAIPLLGMNPDWLSRHLTDPDWLAAAEAPVNWDGWEWLIGVALLVTTVVFALRIRKQLVQSILGLYVSTAVCTLAFLVSIGPKIEQYMQGPLIDFCEAKWNQPVYVQTSFTSYAPLFYTRKQPPVSAESRDLYWLTNGPVDKQTFIITTASDAARYRYNANLELLSEEYGYVFFRRKQYQ